MEQNHSGSGYFARGGVHDWREWRNRYSDAKDRMLCVLTVVQPFIQEDLRPIQELADDSGQVASRRVIHDAWLKGLTGERYAHLTALVSGEVHRRLEDV